MFRFDHPLKSPIFDFHAPLGPIFRGVLSIPHSGEDVPEVFKSFLSGDEKAYQEDVDFKVDELVDIVALQKEGIAVIKAHVHRVCVDLNRAESNCVLFWKENTKQTKIVIKNPSPEETSHFIDIFYRPYFEILKASLKDLEKRKSGPVSMVDLHSMPSKVTEYHLKQNPHQKSHRENFCVSDRKGLTSSPEFINFFHQAFRQGGYTSALNDPYVGGYITEYVNQFRTNNIQIEINRSIYMDEEKKVLIPEKVTKLRPFLTKTLIDGFIKFDS
jgi:N-formylglutamate amidohydrolase